MAKLPKKVQSELDALDDAAGKWVAEVDWRTQLLMLSDMSTKFSGRRISGPAGAELRMLILRQRALIDRWVRQAYVEGVLAGLGKKLTDEGRKAFESTLYAEFDARALADKEGETP